MLPALAALYFAYVIAQFGPQDSVVTVHFDFNIRDHPYIESACFWPFLDPPTYTVNNYR